MDPGGNYKIHLLIQDVCNLDQEMDFVISSNSSARTGISSSKHELSRNEFARLDLASCFALGLITGGPVNIGAKASIPSNAAT